MKSCKYHMNKPIKLSYMGAVGTCEMATKHNKILECNKKCPYYERKKK